MAGTTVEKHGQKGNICWRGEGGSPFSHLVRWTETDWFQVPAGPEEEAVRTAGSQVDAVSSHVLVSGILSCMSECKPHDCETANRSLNQLWCLRWWTAT
jgi:hypothetical protein